MEGINKLERIISEIKILDNYDKTELLKRIKKLIKGSKTKENNYSLLGLSGLGKNIWGKNNISADEYIDTERESWN